ncbi:uncharacterized protein PpBr36_09259 [Pyricularia pennisetigena]|uniref:uncharacterized protein n=1 Tax=Pyricularia pennisetigena TaxID=1578925 RepID=UPI0011514E35|nr:uncharacterized protein PpBr36_09259 [Pyricularia pennisetigena]TLS22106.1 hypothetical protein PpBr36_09259 [Pyricularia pennisetigena]
MSSPLDTSFVPVELEIAGSATVEKSTAGAVADAPGTVRPWANTASATTVVAAVVMPGVFISVTFGGVLRDIGAFQD